jgi:transketolase
MRKKFAIELFGLMKKDKRLVLVVGDLGFGTLDGIKNELPDQFYNVGAAEQSMMCIAIGLTLGGRIPIVYSITPFLIFRPFEAIRNYLNRESIPVIMVGAGRGDDYASCGFSHSASDDDILKQFKNINFIAPENDFNLSEIIYSGKPTYLNLKR